MLNKQIGGVAVITCEKSYLQNSPTDVVDRYV